MIGLYFYLVGKLSSWGVVLGLPNSLLFSQLSVSRLYSFGSEFICCMCEEWISTPNLKKFCSLMKMLSNGMKEKE